MASSSPIFVMLFIITTTAFSLPPASYITATESNPKPKRWPDQFHSILVMNFSGQLQLIDLWYDWTNGRNFNIIQSQLGHLLYDLEWNNGTSFFYTLDSDRQCSSAQLDVGIITPNWLDGATYLGQRHVDGFLCNVWGKADFITYYEDVLTKRPVHWLFYTGRAAHVMTFEVGAALEDAKWQVPSYCFDQKTPATSITKSAAQESHPGGGLAHDVVERYMKDRANTIGTTMHRSLFDFSSMRASL